MKNLVISSLICGVLGLVIGYNIKKTPAAIISSTVESKSEEKYQETSNNLAQENYNKKTTLPDGTVIEESGVKKSEGTTVKASEKKAEEKKAENVVLFPEPKLLLGYTLNVRFDKLEISHSVLVGKQVLAEYVDNLYAVAGADVDNKLVVKEGRVGLIKLF